MRGPARIPEVLSRLRAVWASQPDLRLGQLLFNIHEQKIGDKTIDLYYVEDEDLIAALEQLYIGGKK